MNFRPTDPRESFQPPKRPSSLNTKAGHTQQPPEGQLCRRTISCAPNPPRTNRSNLRIRGGPALPMEETDQITASSLPDAIGLYSERFHGLLTLFSECFSTFPHGTCSLSVLWKYLALDRVYDLLSAACPSNATLGEKSLAHSTLTRAHTGLTPSMETIPRLVGTAHSWLT